MNLATSCLMMSTLFLETLQILEHNQQDEIHWNDFAPCTKLFQTFTSSLSLGLPIHGETSNIVVAILLKQFFYLFFAFDYDYTSTLTIIDVLIMLNDVFCMQWCHNYKTSRAFHQLHIGLGQNPKFCQSFYSFLICKHNNEMWSQLLFCFIIFIFRHC
jgi:hypothetical protein